MQNHISGFSLAESLLLPSPQRTASAQSALRQERLQHHIISSEAALSVGCDPVLVLQFNHQPKHETMVKTFRLRLLRRIFAGIEVTKGSGSHPVYISIHSIHIPQQKRFDECIICRGRSRPPKPLGHHPPEHHSNFPVGQL